MRSICQISLEKVSMDLEEGRGRQMELCGGQTNLMTRGNIQRKVQGQDKSREHLRVRPSHVRPETMAT